MILLQIITVIVCACLFSWGGHNFLSARRDIMPPILALSCCWIIHSWWPLSMLPVVAVYHMGYGDDSFFKHCFGDGWGRGVWGLLAALCISLGVFLTGHTYSILFILYLIVNFTLENALKRLPQIIGDLIIGSGFSLIVFLLR